MIDFRYHLVSIVSIFMALAVGIVLGAGPLKEDIGNTLTSEVKNLRADKAALRSELDTAEKGTEARDDFTTASNRSLLADRLKDTTVAVVVLPGADPNLVKSTQTTLDVRRCRRGVDDHGAGQLGRPRQGGLPGHPGAAAGQSGRRPARPVRPRRRRRRAGEVGAGQGRVDRLPGRQPRSRVCAPVTSSSYATDQVKMATVAVVVAGPVTGSEASDREARASSLSKLAGALDDAGAGAVLVGPSPRADASNVTSVISTAREDGDQAKELSTVDNGELPMGQASVVFGLLEQEAGKSGQYGLASRRSGRLPAAGDQVATVRALVSGAVAGALAASALRVLRRYPPGGSVRWDRTNHAGRTVTLLEGPAYAVAAAGASGLLGAGPGPVVAAVASAGLGALDDLAGDSSSKGLKGHLGALARGEVTTGVVKIVGLGITGLVSAALVDGAARRTTDEVGSRPRGIPSVLDTLVGGAVVAGSANLLNLLDLRPGRALKATALLGALAATSPRSAVAAGAAAGAAVGLLGPDLAGEAMLGDTGANSAGALLGTALVQRTGRRREVGRPRRARRPDARLGEGVLHAGHRVHARAARAGRVGSMTQGRR